MTRSMRSARRSGAVARSSRERGDVAASMLRVPRFGVDEADHVHSVLRMVEELLRDGLADMAAADDDAFCRYDVCRRHTARALARPKLTSAIPINQNAKIFPNWGLATPLTQLATSTTNAPDRDEVEDADDLVHGRVVSPLLIVRVEPVGLREQDPERQRGEEEEVLLLRPDPIERAPSTRAARTRSGRRRTPTIRPTRSAVSSARRISHPRRSRGCGSVWPSSSAGTVSWLTLIRALPRAPNGRTVAVAVSVPVSVVGLGARHDHAEHSCARRGRGTPELICHRAAEHVHPRDQHDAVDATREGKRIPDGQHGGRSTSTMS